MRYKALACVLALAGALGCGADKTPGPGDVSLDGMDGWDVDGAADIPDGTDDCEDYVDTDGDTIADRHEGEGDPDEDGLPNYLDDDSDNDGIGDAVEAGDSDLCTRPENRDGDDSPDFVDPDSDNDGVSDRDEASVYGTDPTDTDSDDDGVSDLVETAYGSDPLDPADTPRTHGDFVFIVDYMADPDPPRDTLVFGTDLKIADVYITVDTSGSMGGEVTNLQDTLQTVIVPGIAADIPNVQVGVMRFEDCPGGGCPNAINNLQDITDDMDLVQAALDTITDTSLCGGSEPYALALYITATADVSGTGLPAATCSAGYIGYPCFRPGAVPIVIQIGDEPFCEQPFPWIPPTGGCECDPRKFTDDAYMALVGIHAKYIGVNTSGVPGPLGPRPQMEEVANATYSVAMGAPLVFDGNEDGTGLGTEIVDAVSLLASSTPMDISTHVVDVDDGTWDTVDAAIFVDRVEPNTAGGVADPEDPSRVCVSGLATGDYDVDGYPDYFDDVAPGTIVCFDIIAARNETVPRISDTPQLYTAEVRVMGDWVTILDSREIYFLIPPDIHIEVPL